MQVSFFMPIKKPPAMQVECTDFSVSIYKEHRSDILESATNRNQTERRTLGRDTAKSKSK